MSMIDLKKLVPLHGTWEVIQKGRAVRCSRKGATPGEFGHALALLGETLKDGVVECRVRVGEWGPGSAAMIIFRANGEHSYYAAGLGGGDNAYSILRPTESYGFAPLAKTGSTTNVEPNREYHLRLVFAGQRVLFFVDGVQVLEYGGVEISTGLNLGFLCVLPGEEVVFSDMTASGADPKAFVVMQFSSPYNEVYRDAIEPLVREIGFEPLRVDDIFEPTIIINDIKNQVAEASIVIAEITEANPNVYYEVGLSHAMGKPTILLAHRGTKLPFDVGPYRCIFYDNTIPGRARLQESLRRSLETLLGFGARPGKNGAAHS